MHLYHTWRITWFCRPLGAWVKGVSRNLFYIREISTVHPALPSAILFMKHLFWHWRSWKIKYLLSNISHVASGMPRGDTETRAKLPFVLHWDLAARFLPPAADPSPFSLYRPGHRLKHSSSSLRGHYRPWLYNPMGVSPPGSSVNGILQAQILECVAMPSSRRSSRPRDQTCVSSVSCTAGRFFTTEPRGRPLSLQRALQRWTGRKCHGHRGSYQNLLWWELLAFTVAASVKQDELWPPKRYAKVLATRTSKYDLISNPWK